LQNALTTLFCDICFQICVCTLNRVCHPAEAQRAALGKRPLDCWRDVAALLGLQVPAQELFDQTEPLLQERCVLYCCLKLCCDWYGLIVHVDLVISLL
jgi:hypothetical protein